MHVMAVPGRNGRLYAVSIVLTPLSRRSHRHDEQTLTLQRRVTRARQLAIRRLCTLEVGRIVG